MMKIFHLTYPLLVALPSVVFAQNYTMADLEVLQDRRNYKEFFLHAKDIRPSARDKTWKGMVQQMSEGLMRQMLNRPFVSSNDLEEVNSLTSWSTINENYGFQVLRNKFGVKYFKNCFDNKLDKQFCYKKALEFIKKTPEQSQMATDIGTVIYKQKQKLETKEIIGMNLWPFFEQMAKTPISEFYCDKPYFRSEISKQIYQSIDELDTKRLKEKINNITHIDCWNKLKTYYKKSLFSTVGNQRINSYFILNSMGELSKYENGLFLINHLLSYPSPGELFEKSWKKLSEIGKDFRLRDKLIADFKKMDPLPGQIFKYSNEKRSLVIIKALLINFPEYIDLYSKTCLQYFEGTQNFPNGNPTIECVDWFKTARTFKLVPEMTIKRFDAARNFKQLSI